MSEVLFTDDNFEAEVSKSKGVVLVDFFATWCGPCKMQSPIIEEVAKDFEGRAKVGKLDVDQGPKTAEKFEIMSVPTIVVFKDGRMKETLTGVQPKEFLAEKINSLL
ncbi:MAG: thioredoxin [Patescibacteria group bacterium]